MVDFILVAERPDIFKYLNFRHFLNDLVEHLREKGAYSNEKFRRKSGFGSPAQVRMVMQGKRNLSPKAALQMAAAFELTKQEAKYFGALVEFAQAEVGESQEEAYKNVMRLKGLSSSRHLEPSEYEYFSQWINVAVAEALSSRWGKASEKELAELFDVKISEIRSAIETVENLGIVRWDKDSKSYVRNPGPVFTDPQTKSLRLRAFHREMTKQALKKIDELDESKRHLLGLTVSLSRQDYEKFCKRLFEVLRELNIDFGSSAGAEGVYHLNFQLFPLSKV